MSGCAAGSYGATKGASNPTSTITASANSAMRDDRLRRIARTVSPSGDSRGRATLVADAGVGPGIEQIGDETAEGYHDAADDHTSDEKRIITRADGVDDGVTHPRPGEDPLDEKCAGEQRRERQAYQRDRGQQRVAQRVTAQNLALGESFQARRADVVGREDVEERGALVPRHGCRREKNQGQR